MKRSVSDLGMAKKMRKAFTLIEVMVSVMIITVVVMALYAMNGNTSFIYEKSVHAMPVNQYLSFLPHMPSTVSRAKRARWRTSLRGLT